MIPSKVYVGDRASLIIPLPGHTITDNIAIDLNQLPVLEEIIIHSILLERRPAGSRLLIEFSAFAPGVLYLPELALDDKIFEGLKVEISSILEMDNMGMVLSGPAPPLAMPGTSLLIFGAISITIVLLIFCLWISIRGRKTIRILKDVWHRRQIFSWALKAEKRLRRELLNEISLRHILDTLSATFRSFLSFFSGQNCQAMTAEELGSLNLVQNAPDSKNDSFLKDFFLRCDKLRFSGSKIQNSNAESLLDEFKTFILVMKAETKKKRAVYG